MNTGNILAYSYGVDRTVGSNPTASTKETDSNGYFFNKPCKQWVMGSNPIEGCKLLVAQSGLEQLKMLKTFPIFN